MHFFQSHSHISSPVHRAPTGLKLALALGLVVATVALPLGHQGLGIFLAAAAGALVLIAILSRIPLLFLLQRLMMLELLAVGVALLALLQPQGWLFFLLILARSTVCLATMILLSNTTPFGEILRVLKRVGFPSLLVTIMALMYRYLFVLADESLRMRRARASRTFVGGRAHVWQALTTVIGQLFVRSVDRAERIYVAMCARGWK